jgi:hypothetical protein
MVQAEKGSGKDREQGGMDGRGKRTLNVVGITLKLEEEVTAGDGVVL